MNFWDVHYVSDGPGERRVDAGAVHISSGEEQQPMTVIADESSAGVLSNPIYRTCYQGESTADYDQTVSMSRFFCAVFYYHSYY